MAAPEWSIFMALLKLEAPIQQAPISDQERRRFNRRVYNDRHQEERREANRQRYLREREAILAAAAKRYRELAAAKKATRCSVTN